MGVLAHESFGVACVGGEQCLGAAGAYGLGVFVMDVDGVVSAEAAVVVLGVVPAEELLAERSGVGDRAERLGEVRLVSGS